jgi:hypothetical protein
MKFEAVTFGIYQPSGTLYAELRLDAAIAGKPEQGGESVRLRRYATAEQFLTDFCAGPDAATEAWIDSQVDEEYVAPASPEE